MVFVNAGRIAKNRVEVTEFFQRRLKIKVVAK